MKTVEDLGTILGVWAHPDDETYLSAALMCQAVRNGQRVRCVTATRGEKGSWDEARWPSETMGAVREQELLRCLDILGVSDHHWLDYVDAECPGVDVEEAVGKILAHIEAVRPDTVLTFGPDGMTGHADHKAVSAWTTEACRRAGIETIYYAVHTPEWAQRWVPVLNQFNVFEEGPPVVEVADLAIHFAAPGELLDLKLAAIAEHVSQSEGMLAAFGPDVFREAMNQENYQAAATGA
jgi:LmbE family N-acetylglucosaminyl deacetylase